MNGQQDDKRITDVVERTNMQWVDQFNQNLLLTVQALQALHKAFDGKFSR